MTVRELHREAIDMLKQAQSAKSIGKKAEYNYFLTLAFNHEKQAAMLLEHSYEAEPTRSVLFRSAANMALQLRLYEDSNTLVNLALAGTPPKEIEDELKALLPQLKEQTRELEEVYFRAETSPTLVYDYKNEYFDNLLRKAVQFRLVDTSKYGGAVVIAHVIEFLRNIQQSFQNFGEVKLDRILVNEDKNNRDYLLSKFRSNTNLLGVDLNWKSFGISVVADDGIVEQNEIYSKDYKEMRRDLFEEFKRDVILPSYNDTNFQREISEKYSNEERKKIFGPLINVISKTKPYSISITENNYENEIKKFKPLSKAAQHVLKPNVEVKNIDHPISIFRTIEQTKGSKKKTLISEQVTNIEMRTTLSQVSYGKKNIVFINPYEIIVRFDENTWRIEDEYFQVFVTSNDYDEVLDLYNRSLVENFTLLLITELKSLSNNELELLERLNNTALRDW